MAKTTVLPKGAYVYAILVDGVVRYIGKGTGKRHAHHVVRAKRGMHSRFYDRLRAAIAAEAKIEHRILKDGLTEKQAIAEELRQIARRSGLWNANGGGAGVTSAAKKLWWVARPDHPHRAAIAARNRLPKYRRLSGIAARKRWQNKRLKEQMRARVKLAKQKCRAVTRERMRASSALRWARPGARERAGRSAVERYRKHRAAYRAGYAKRSRNIKWRRRLSLAAKRRHRNAHQLDSRTEPARRHRRSVVGRACRAASLDRRRL